ncbi:MAG TPA: TetR/AcrR family transcriptional regulator [Pseudonocardiaceae bacterium]|nr:TetR/AcrR family transcriptional regulator [Pseudonocardiaceae bacterium]
MTADPPRRLRADAQRNRERLLEAALRAFTTGGADVTLEAIARQAGVGIGTLYRHFPTREALVEAVYRNELAGLCARAADLLATEPPDQALRDWMGHFVAYQSTKHGMADALRAVIASGGDPFAQSRTRVRDAMATLVKAGVAAGTIRDDVDSFDILASVSGMALAAVDPEQVDRLLDLLVDGLRPRG